MFTVFARKERRSDSTTVDSLDCSCDDDGDSLIPAFTPLLVHCLRATIGRHWEEVAKRFGFTPRRLWLLKGLSTAVEAFRAAAIKEIYIDGSFCTDKPDLVILTATGLNLTSTSMTASISLDRFRTRCSAPQHWEMDGCGPTMALSSSSTQRCKLLPARDS